MMVRSSFRWDDRPHHRIGSGAAAGIIASDVGPAGALSAKPGDRREQMADLPRTGGGPVQPDWIELPEKFEAAWLLADRPRIEDYLRQAPEHAWPDLLVRLLEIEC